MQLDFEKEKVFRVDGIFYKKAKNDFKVPIIFIESENNLDSTETEIYKLCCLNAPLKIIFICHEWSEEKKEDTTEGHWDYIINDFKQENILIGHLGVIVAEWMDELKFHSFSYNENGGITKASKLLQKL